MSTRPVRTHVIATVLGSCAVMGFQLSAQSPAAGDDRITQLETRIAALERQINSRGPLTVTAPFTVQDKKGRTLLIVDGDGSTGVDLAVGGSETASVHIGTSRKVATVTAEAEGRPVVTLISSDEDSGVEVVKFGGKPLADNRLAFLGQTDQAVDAGGVVTVNNAAGDPVAALAARKGGGEIQVTNATGEENTGAELSVTADGGRLRVFDKSGQAVGGVFGSAKGGGLALTGPGGGFSAVSLGVNKSGGSVRVFAAAGGPARAALEAAATTGGVTAYDQQGHPAATLASVTSGSGILQLLSNGTTMVEAGTSQDNVGLVKAGPRTGGAIGTIVPPFMLVGRKE